MEKGTHPTFTQVPPSLFASTTIVFAPWMPDALLAQASPPDPPPITRKSHSLVIGAMVVDELLNCLLIEFSRVVLCAAFEAVVGTARVIRVKAFMCVGYDAGNRYRFIDCWDSRQMANVLTLALLYTRKDMIWYEEALLMEQ